MRCTHEQSWHQPRPGKQHADAVRQVRSPKGCSMPCCLEAGQQSESAGRSTGGIHASAHRPHMIARKLVT